MLDLITDGLRSLGAVLCQVIYMLIAGLYDLFINISRVELLSSENIQPIYQRITMILTIVMVFYVTFETVKFVIQPEQFSDKEKGASKIVVRMILVVLLIAFIPKIFTWGYQIQNKIFDTQVFSKVILGKKDVNVGEFGKNLSYNIFTMFYGVDEGSFTKAQLEEEDNCDKIPCKTVVMLNLNKLRTEGNLPLLHVGLNKRGKVTEEASGQKIEKYYINFNWIFAIGVGGFVTYILLLYCIDAGVRVVQLLFLQVIAPIPIMGYLSPKKDGMFEKWTKQCITTYLDLFIRVAIIHFILLICEILNSAYVSGTLVNGVDEDTKWLIYIALIMGLLLFAQKAPKMLGELFPKMGAASGNFGLKATERVAPLAARAAGMALGSTRAVGGFVARGVNRHVRNKANGAKSILSKEGREQFANRWKNRLAMHKAGGAANRAEKTAEKAATDAKAVEAAKNKVKTANEAYKAALETKDASKIAKAKSNLDKAASEYRRFNNDRMSTPEMQQRKAAITNGNFQNAKENLKKANEELETARKSGDKNKIKDAEQKVDNAKQELKKEVDNIKNDNQEQMKEYRETSSSKKVAEMAVEAASQARVEADQARSQVADDNNTKYGSAVGAALWGAVAGGVTGAAAGAKAQKLEEIIPKAKEGWQKDVKNIQELNKYYDNGGNVGFVGGTIDRTVAKVEKSVGIDTSYARVNLENQRIESEVKKIDSSISHVDNAKKEFDATEDRIKAKLDDNKVTATKESTLKTKSGTEYTVTKGQDYAAINREFRAKAKNANAISEAASKQLQEKESQIANIDPTQKEKYNKYAKGEMVGPLTEKEQNDFKLLQEYEQAKLNANQKSEEAVRAERDAKDIEKETTRAIMTEMINDPYFEQKTDLYDGVAIQTLKRNYNEIRIANQDSELRTRLLSELSPEDYAAFANCKFKDYKQMDNVMTALSNVKSTLTIEKQRKQDQKYRNETSSETQAKKAAQEYNGGSGK